MLALQRSFSGFERNCFVLGNNSATRSRSYDGSRCEYLHRMHACILGKSSQDSDVQFWCFAALTYSQLEEEVVGHSIQMFCGPKSKAAIIWKALKDVLQNIKSQIHLMLCDRGGQYQNLCSTLSPYFDSAGEKYGCLLKLEHSEAVSMDRDYRTVQLLRF
jgi:hypothetical protein